jgi:hypothetical protein
MRTKKEQDPAQAQLTLYYQLHEDKLPVTNPEHASQLFMHFARYHKHIDGWYVIFLDRKKRFMCWHCLENFIDIPAISADIAGFAKIIKARHVIMARLDSGKNSTVGYLDICWIASMLKCCGERHIELDDYMVVTEKGWCSYQDGEFIE